MRSRSYIAIAVLAMGISACRTDTREVASATTAAADESFASNESAAQPAATVGTAAAPDTTLPSTASPLALTGLVGLLSLGGAALVRHLR